jgi:hypothetical protein
VSSPDRWALLLLLLLLLMARAHRRVLAMRGRPLHLLLLRHLRREQTLADQLQAPGAGAKEREAHGLRGWIGSPVSRALFNPFFATAGRRPLLHPGL